MPAGFSSGAGVSGIWIVGALGRARTWAPARAYPAFLTGRFERSGGGKK